MIELLLQAERALAMGLLDQAQRLYDQAIAADPRNSIAVVGLARVALERADDREACRLAKEALAIDPENVAAARLVARLEETYPTPGLALPAATTTREVAPASRPAASPAPVSSPAPASEPVASPALTPSSAAPLQPSAPVDDRSLLDRLLRRNRP